MSEAFASMLSLALDAGSATGGLVTPAVGGAITAAGYDRDFADLPLDGESGEPVAVQTLVAMRLRGRVLLRRAPVVLDLNGVVKGRTVDDALTLLGGGWVSAGGDVATCEPLEVGLFASVGLAALARFAKQVAPAAIGGIALSAAVSVLALAFVPQ